MEDGYQAFFVSGRDKATLGYDEIEAVGHEWLSLMAKKEVMTKGPPGGRVREYAGTGIQPRENADLDMYKTYKRLLYAGFHDGQPRYERVPGADRYAVRWTTKVRIKHFQMGPTDDHELVATDREKEMRFLSNKGRVVYAPKDLAGFVSEGVRKLLRGRYHWRLLRWKHFGVPLPPLGMVWWRDEAEFARHAASIRTAGIGDSV